MNDVVHEAEKDPELKSNPLADEASRFNGVLASKKHIPTTASVLPEFGIDTNSSAKKHDYLLTLVASGPPEKGADPEKHTMAARVFSWGWTFDIKGANGQSEGVVDQKMLRWSKTFEYSDAAGNKKATGTERVLSWGTKIDVSDEKGKPIGGIQEQVFKSLWHPYTTYSIVDAQGKELAKSEKVEVFSTDFTLTNNKGEKIATVHRPPLNLIRDNWSINIFKPDEVDKRILYMIPAYKTSADADKAAAEAAAAAAAEEDEKKDDDN